MAAGQPENLVVLGREIAFRPGTDMERARKAASYVEEMYAGQKERTRGMQTRDNLLTFIVLGLADEILQMKKKEEREQVQIAALLEKIDKIM